MGATCPHPPLLTDSGPPSLAPGQKLTSEVVAHVQKNFCPWNLSEGKVGAESPQPPLFTGGEPGLPCHGQKNTLPWDLGYWGGAGGHPGR